MEYNRNPFQSYNSNNYIDFNHKSYEPNII